MKPRVILLASLVGLTAMNLLAQQDRIPDRIVKPGGGARRVVLTGNRTPQAQPQDDAEPVEPSLRIAGITLLLKRSPAQAAEIENLLDDLQNPASREYHGWLTPEEYADRFGVSANDFARIASWLESQGLRIDYSSRSRTWISFSGSAAQVQDAFHTEIHLYRAGQERHFANASDPSIPEELEPVVQLIQGLDDFRMKPHWRKIVPRLSLSDGSHYLVPGDLAAIYNINPLYQKGINGSGQKMVVVGQTGFGMADVQSFRSQFGLVKNDPQPVLVPGYPDPGISQDDLGEALLDLEYSGGIAPNATLLYVYSNNVVISAYYAIDQNLAPVISMSYGGCEPMISSNPANSAAAYRSLAQQAATEGITWVAASGDSGAADCEPQGSSPAGIHGPAVDLPGSIPEVTSVGGSEFNEGTGKYWAAINASNGSSAQSYIPEMAWNDTLADGGLASGGGGASIFFSKPAWQTGPGVPNDNARDVPDVAFTASWDHDPYVLIVSGAPVPNGGTSAATPVFAAMLTLLNQYAVANGIQSKPGLGNINPNLYRLAQTTSGIFHDITVGSNVVPCQAGTTNCSSGSYGYRTEPGFDLATGLGSVDVNNFVTGWHGGSSTPAATSTSTTVTAAPAGILAGAATLLTATVRAASGSSSPSGAVSFAAGRTALGTANLSGSGGAATASLTVYGSQLAVGGNSIAASYGGTTNFTPSSGSATVTVTVPTAASAVVPSIVPNPVYQQDPDGDGYAWYTVRLTEIAGTPTTLTGFSIAGSDHRADIPSWFGSTSLPAHGTLSAAIRSRNLAVPVDRVFTFSGTDANGQNWSQQLTVPFLPQQISASMALSSSPGTEIQNPNGDPACSADHPYYQQLNLQEQNGLEVQLTKFLAAGIDLSSGIADWFGSVRLAPLGTLHANICWKIAGAPTTLNYEIDGTDTAGHKISATAAVLFQGPGQSAGALSASKSALAMSASPSQSATANLTVTVPANEPWTVSVFPANQKSSWLVVFPQSGTGPSAVNLVASAAGLSSGVYSASLVFQSVKTIPQFVNVPVTFTIGASSAISISGVTNAASYQQAVAPGMLLSVFGRNLANSTKGAPSVPLPTTLDGVSATVNGVPAPLHFISPGQLNIQVPYETAAGAAVLGVNNNGQVTSFPLAIKLSAPGIFAAGDGALVPLPSARRGDSIPLFLTGEGDTNPPLPNGAPPAAATAFNQLPTPRQPLSMTVGGVPVTPFFAAIPWGLVGVTQVNFTVPPNAPLGLQPVVVSVGGVASKPAALNILPGSGVAASFVPSLSPTRTQAASEELDAPQLAPRK
ncbi:MAG: Ig-like domain repeat protein [Acidobacteriia bacterium]|nr:Ig-like domain repeat protein [Terriglobia bacterium]